MVPGVLVGRHQVALADRAARACPAALHPASEPGRHDTLNSCWMPLSVASIDRDQVTPPSVVEMTVAVPLAEPRPPTATQASAEVQEIPFSW